MHIAHAGAFNLDDACAHICQLARGKRRSNRMFQRDNGNAFKGLHRGLSEGSGEGRRSVHRQPAFMIAAPQANGFAIG